MIRPIVIEVVLFGNRVKLHRRRVRQHNVVEPNLLMGWLGRLFLFDGGIVPREVELPNDRQQTGRVGRAGRPAVGADVLASFVDVGAADEVGVARHRRELFYVILDAGDHRVIGAKARRDGDVLAAVPLLGGLVVDLACPVARLDSEQVVGLYSKLAGSVGAFQTRLRNAERRQQMGAQAALPALLDHHVDERLLLRFGGCSVGHVVLQARCDLRRNVWKFAFEVGAGAGRGSVEAVHGQAAVLVAGVGQLLDAVSAADVGAEVEQRRIGLVADVPIRRAAVVGDLDRNSPLVVPRRRAAPRTVGLVAEQADAAVGINGIVGAHLAGFFANDRAEPLQRGIARHVVHCDLADGLAAGSVAVGANGRITYQCGITHRRRLLCRWKVLHPFPGSKSYLFQAYSTSKCVSLFKLSDPLLVDAGHVSGHIVVGGQCSSTSPLDNLIKSTP